MADREKQSSAYDQHYDNDPLDEDTDEKQQEEFQFPEHGARTAIIVGIGGGLLSVLFPVIVTLIAAGLYQQGQQLSNNMPVDLARTLFLLTCLGLFLNAATAFVAGLITGRLVVRRSLGFLAGALVGIITYAGYAVENIIPNYPGHITSNTTSTPTQTPTGVLIGTLILVAVLAVYALIGGLMGRWGAAAATNKHPYYELGREEQ